MNYKNLNEITAHNQEELNAVKTKKTYKYYQYNIDGLINALEAIKGQGFNAVKISDTGSSAIIYGSRKGVLSCVTEQINAEVYVETTEE